MTPDSSAARSSALSRAYRVNLEMLAMVALLTGGFLVFSAHRCRWRGGGRSLRCCACWGWSGRR